VPFIIYAPGARANGQPSRSLVEMLDVYPTLCDLAGLPAPAVLQGRSLRPILADAKATIHEAAFTQARRGPDAKNWGRSVRTARWRCTEWDEGSSGLELYDHDADPQTILRIVQSVPSPKAEPIKQWLAKVGYERIKEIADPELSINRARENWQKYGRSEKWIQQRMMGQETRNKLTDFWSEHQIKEGEEYAILTNLIHQEWSGISVKQHKDLKGLETQNLRDHMSEAELIFTALAELSTRQIAESADATGMEENKSASVLGGRIAKRARLELEEETGKSVITNQNFLPKEKKRIEKKTNQL
jgi:hypothetical protein